jgi:hypothetical protein
MGNIRSNLITKQWSWYPYLKASTLSTSRIETTSINANRLAFKHHDAAIGVRGLSFYTCCCFVGSFQLEKFESTSIYGWNYGRSYTYAFWNDVRFIIA